MMRFGKPQVESTRKKLRAAAQRYKRAMDPADHSAQTLSWPPNLDLWMLAFAGVALSLVASRWSDADLWLSQQFFDPYTTRFPFREASLWQDLLHDGLKWLSAAVWFGLLCIRVSRIGIDRIGVPPRELSLILLSSLLIVITTSYARSMSSHSCPWHLAQFGGSAQFFRLLDVVPIDAGPGRCLPSGHASSAFMWLAAVPILGGRKRRYMLAIVLGLGVLAGVVQVARGAHFASHVLLSGTLAALAAALTHQLAVRSLRARHSR